MRIPRIPALAAAGVLALAAPAAPAADAARLNATARFLAGLPTPSFPGMEGFVHDPGWAAHAVAMDRAWAALEKERLAPMRAWSARELGDLRGSATVFYPFGGPDHLHVQVLHPWAQRFVLVGLEPVGSLPELGRLAIRRDLAHLRTTLRTALLSSFFITKDMERDLKHPELRGVLPLLLAFLPRLEGEIRDLALLELDPEGRPRPAQGKPTALRIRFRAAGGGPERELWYLRADLSNGALHRDRRILAFAASLGRPHTFLKSASYLLHRPSFTTFRAFLLQTSSSILQDDSGIPQRSFDEARWPVRFYGRYDEPIPLFREFTQKDLADRFQGRKVRALDFGMGYKHRGRSSNLELALAPAPGGGARGE
ncbi:MAG: hypothetical protein HY823_10850 [Acidobacteria bacterium]|nr:hypothetical protein [Acidobacteriota bacterium]